MVWCDFRLCFVFWILSLSNAMSQQPMVPQLSGRVVDSLTGNAVEHASVALFRRSDTSLVTGAIRAKR